MITPSQLTKKQRKQLKKVANRYVDKIFRLIEDFDTEHSPYTSSLVHINSHDYEEQRISQCSRCNVFSPVWHSKDCPELEGIVTEEDYIGYKDQGATKNTIRHQCNRCNEIFPVGEDCPNH